MEPDAVRLPPCGAWDLSTPDLISFFGSGRLCFGFFGFNAIPPGLVLDISVIDFHPELLGRVYSFPWNLGKPRLRKMKGKALAPKPK